MKIAIAVESDKMKVAKRMGHAPWFAIFNVEASEFKLINLAENEHAKEHDQGGHHHHEENNETEIENHRQHIKPLKGVDGILARAVGPHMKEAIAREGITVYRLPLSAGRNAEELLRFFIDHEREEETFKI